jgi:Predicted membrane protein (DUF2127)
MGTNRRLRTPLFRLNRLQQRGRESAAGAVPAGPRCGGLQDGSSQRELVLQKSVFLRPRLAKSGSLTCDNSRFVSRPLYVGEVSLAACSLRLTRSISFGILWNRKVWEYPVAVVALALSIADQVVRWTSIHSTTPIFFTVIDAVTIWLTIRECRRLKRQ